MGSFEDIGTALPVVAILQTIPAHTDAVWQIVSETIPTFRREEGCDQYQALADLDDPARIVIIEKWRNAEALQEHFESAAFQSMAKKLEGLLSGQPQVMRLKDV